MKSRAPDPQRLEVAAMAAAGTALSGLWPAAELPRWAASQAAPHDGLLADVAWQVAGERKLVPGSEPEVWLQLKAQAQSWLTCQRCLQPFEEILSINRRLRFVRSEAEAEALDAELEEDVLSWARPLNLRELVEDELLLSLPLVPRHGVCPQPLPLGARLPGLADGAASGPNEAPDGAAECAHPFAALQALKRRGS